MPSASKTWGPGLRSRKTPGTAKIRYSHHCNVFGYTLEDYVEVLRVLEDADGLAGYELNISCPNVKRGACSSAATRPASPSC